MGVWVNGWVDSGLGSVEQIESLRSRQCLCVITLDSAFLSSARNCMLGMACGVSFCMCVNLPACVRDQTRVSFTPLWALRCDGVHACVALGMGREGKGRAKGATPGIRVTGEGFEEVREGGRRGSCTSRQEKIRWMKGESM